MSFPDFRGPETLALISPWLTDCELGWTNILTEQEKVRLAGAAIKPEASKMHAWWTKNQSALQGGTWTDFCVKFLDEADPNWRQFAVQDYNNFQQGSLLPDQYTDAFWDAVRMLQRAGSDSHSPQQRISHIVSCANKDVKDSLHSVLGPDIAKWTASFDDVVREIRKLDDHLIAPAPQPGVGSGSLQRSGPTPANQLFARSPLWGVNIAGSTSFDSEAGYVATGLKSVFDLGSWEFVVMFRIKPAPPAGVNYTTAPAIPISAVNLSFYNATVTTRSRQFRAREGDINALPVRVYSASPGEYFKSAAVSWTQTSFTGGNGVTVTDGYITSLSFTTSQGRTISQGGLGSQQYSAPAGQRIVGIYGTQKDQYFRTIGFLTGPLARGDR